MNPIRVLACVAAVLVSPAVTADERALREDETSERTFELPASGERRLVVDNVWGPVTVRPHDANTIELTLHRSLRADTAAELAEARRDTALDVVHEGGRVELRVDGPFRWDERGKRHHQRDIDWEAHFAFEIKVPRRIDLEVSTVLEGDVRVEGVEGDLRLANVVDRVVATGIAGGGSVESVAGDVEVVLAAAPRSDWTFETVAGDIDVRMPDGASASARFGSQWGEMFSDFAVTPIASEPVATRVADGKWSLGNAGPTMQIGAGGPLLSFESVAGDVYLRKARP